MQKYGIWNQGGQMLGTDFLQALVKILKTMNHMKCYHKSDTAGICFMGETRQFIVLCCPKREVFR